MRGKMTLSKTASSLERFVQFFSSLNKEDQDKVVDAELLRGKLIYDLPKEYRKAYREYQKLISQNEDLFQRQKLMTDIRICFESKIKGVVSF